MKFILSANRNYFKGDYLKKETIILILISTRTSIVFFNDAKHRQKQQQKSKVL